MAAYGIGITPCHIWLIALVFLSTSFGAYAVTTQNNVLGSKVDKKKAKIVAGAFAGGALLVALFAVYTMKNNTFGA